MIVVSNTSPLNYLILIEQIELLPQLFGKIIIPEAVRSELSDPLAPHLVRDWISTPPSWLQVQYFRSGCRLEINSFTNSSCSIKTNFFSGF